MQPRDERARAPGPLSAIEGLVTARKTPAAKPKAETPAKPRPARKAPAKRAPKRAPTPKPKHEPEAEAEQSTDAPRGPVRAAVEVDLERLSQRGADVAETGLAAAALSLASALDRPEHSLAARTAATKALQGVLRELYAMAPPKEAGDELDGILRDIT